MRACKRVYCPWHGMVPATHKCPYMTKDPIEWEFEVPSSQVDLERISSELNELPIIYAIAYMHNLKIKAPVVYERFKAYCYEHNCLRWYRFDQEANNGKAKSYEDS